MTRILEIWQVLGNISEIRERLVGMAEVVEKPVLLVSWCARVF